MSITKVTRYSNLLLGLTSLHHVYGAYIYDSPWRLHVLLISLPAMIITSLLTQLLRSKYYSPKDFRFWVYWLSVLVASITLIGLYEGVYNHMLKNVLFYANVNPAILHILFPPPTYQLPNDFWFELTGVLQGVIWAPLLVHFTRLTQGSLLRGSEKKCILE